MGKGRHSFGRAAGIGGGVRSNRQAAEREWQQRDDKHIRQIMKPRSLGITSISRNPVAPPKVVVQGDFNSPWWGSPDPDFATVTITEKVPLEQVLQMARRLVGQNPIAMDALGKLNSAMNRIVENVVKQEPVCPIPSGRVKRKFRSS